MRFSDEQIICALLQNGSVRAAAKALGCSESVIRDRLKGKEFSKLYKERKFEVLTAAADKMKNNISLAVDTLSAVMSDTENPPTVRVSASDSLLRHCLRYVEVTDIIKRIEALEAIQEESEALYEGL